MIILELAMFSMINGHCYIMDYKLERYFSEIHLIDKIVENIVRVI